MKRVRWSTVLVVIEVVLVNILLFAIIFYKEYEFATALGVTMILFELFQRRQA